MAHYTLNQEHDGIEICFDAKPDNDTLTTLKSNGFRWHGRKKVWYAKRTNERLTLAESLATLSDTPTNDVKKVDRQKELKEILREIASDYWKTQRMIDHTMKNTAYIVELNDGDIYTIDKPTIETRFCFGYGYCGISTDEQEDEAYKSMRHAETNEAYFLRENMKHIDGMLDNLTSSKYRIYKHVKYCGECDTRYKGISFYDCFEEPNENLKDCKLITDEERKALIEGYEEVKKAFRKRLDTYLKKYGLSKLHTWTYLRD